jgi:hypothetical protein
MITIKIELFCLIWMTVTSHGDVKDVIVVESTAESGLQLDNLTDVISLYDMTGCVRHAEISLLLLKMFKVGRQNFRFRFKTESLRIHHRILHLQHHHLPPLPSPLQTNRTIFGSLDLVRALLSVILMRIVLGLDLKRSITYYHLPPLLFLLLLNQD